MENASKPAPLQCVYEFRPRPGLDAAGLDAAATAATGNGRGLGLDLGLLGHGLGLGRALVDGISHRTAARDTETDKIQLLRRNTPQVVGRGPRR